MGCVVTDVSSYVAVLYERFYSRLFVSLVEVGV